MWRDADEIQKPLERAPGGPLREPSMSLERAEELVAAIRADAPRDDSAFDSAVRWLSNNRRDFPKSIAEIDVVYPDELPIA